VRPSQHYSMGGVRVNKDGQAYGLAGLFAVGEASCWDMHGFNRLGGNSLAETLVAGRVVGGAVARFARGTPLSVELDLARQFLADQRRRVADWLDRVGRDGPSVFEIRDAMGDIMINRVGIFREGEGLSLAVQELDGLLEQLGQARLDCGAPGVNPELSFALRLRGMLRLCRVTAAGALARTESRGAHCRTDFPARNDASWLNRTLVRWGRDEEAPRFDYEPVGLLDLPPGDRGYGQSERVAMSQSLEAYNAAVEAGQRKHGRLDTEEDFGARLEPGAWQDAEARAGLKGH